MLKLKTKNQIDAKEMAQKNNKFIYHISTLSLEELKNQKNYSHPSLEEEGFIHLSTSTQLHKVVENFYFNQANLVLFKVNSQKLINELKYEKAEDLNDFFPHLYGHLNMDAVESFSLYEKDKTYPSH